MQIFPAIDLSGGQVVRLYQGDYDKMTVYGQDPCAAARDFIAAGAKYLHVVDLDGAKDGTLANFESIAAIAKQGGLYIEVGGGTGVLAVDGHLVVVPLIQADHLSAGQVDGGKNLHDVRSFTAE